MEEFLGELIPATPYEDESKEFLVSKCHELENKWLSEQKTAMELAYEIEQQNSQLSELKRQNTALLVAMEAKNVALNQVLYSGNPYAGSIEEALTLSPSAELLEARDRRRDAKLIRAAREFFYERKVVTFENIANLRESGSWIPELGD